jgi:hypothetical protein
MKELVERVEQWVAEKGGLPLIANPLLDEVDEELFGYRIDFWEPGSLGNDEANEFFAFVPNYDDSVPSQRFIVLNQLWLTRSEGRYAHLHEADLAERSDTIERFLQTVVGYLSPHACSSVMQIQWELMLAAELGLWDRVNDLHRHWRKTWKDDAKAADATVARVLIVPSMFEMKPESWSIDWWIEYPYDDAYAKLGSGLITDLAAIVGGPSSNRLTPSVAISVAEETLNRVRDGAELLRRQDESGVELDTISLSLLAWANAVIGILAGSREALSRSSAVYSRLLDDTPASNAKYDKRRFLLLTSVRLRTWSDDIAGARSLAEQLVFDYPDDPYYWEILAQLRRKEGDTAGWVHAFEEYARRASHLDSDWSTTELLNLGLARASESDLVRLVESAPIARDDFSTTYALLDLMWSDFAYLEPAAQRRAAHGVMFLTNPRIAVALGDARWSKAATDFGEAANEQLKAVFMQPLAIWVRSKRIFDQIRLRHGDDEYRLLTTLKQPDVATLGSVEKCLRLAEHSSGQIGPFVRSWITHNESALLPSLAELITLIKQLADTRNAATHTAGTTREQAFKAFEYLRRLASLLRPLT